MKNTPPSRKVRQTGQDRFTSCFKTYGTVSLFEEGRVLVQSPFDAKAVQTLILLVIQACMLTLQL